MYKQVKNILSESDCKVIKKLIKNSSGKTRKDFKCQMDTDFSNENIPQLNILLGMFLQLMCKETSLNLKPSYAYARIYRKGTELFPHIDREGSEYGLTINISQTEPWDIYMENIPIRQKPGDGLIYAGCEIKHSRNTYEGDEYIQLMLFYSKNGFDVSPNIPIGGPVLISDIFAINEEFDVELVDGDILVIDGLFKDWTKIRNVHIDAPVFNWKMPEGTRNFIDYYDCRHHFIHHQKYPFTGALAKILEKVHKCNFQRVLGENNSLRTNWFKQIKPKTSDWAQIHRDGHTPGEFTMITFLNTKEECSGGTSLFKTMDTKYMDGHTGMDYWSHVPIENLGKIVNIEMKPNRTIIFRSEIPHAAWHPIDSFYNFPRHNIVFRFQKDHEKGCITVVKK